MYQASTCQSNGRHRSFPLNDQQNNPLGPAILKASNFLAVLCLLFGIAFIGFVPATLEQRIGGLFLFGLFPAAGLYAGGHILSQLSVLGCKLCEIIVAHCFRCFALLPNYFVVWPIRPVSDASIGRLTALVRHLRCRCWRAPAVFIYFLCLLIRSIAIFFISMQAFCVRWVSDLSPRGWRLRPLIMAGMLLSAFCLGWCGGNFIWLPDRRPNDLTGGTAIEAVVERIIGVESNGDPNKKNKRSSATGLGQFLDETWLHLIQTHRPDLASGRNQDKTLELRRDPIVAREITTRFTEQNAALLRKRGLPVTPGTLYLAHFAGGAGAVAILSALENADAASVMASADATGRTKREKIIKANPFLERFTVADLRTWADRKMRIPSS